MNRLEGSVDRVGGRYREDWRSERARPAGRQPRGHDADGMKTGRFLQILSSWNAHVLLSDWVWLEKGEGSWVTSRSLAWAPGHRGREHQGRTDVGDDLRWYGIIFLLVIKKKKWMGTD